MQSTILWNDNWNFLWTPLGTSWEEMQQRKDEFSPVEIPHDWLIWNAKDLYQDGFGWYRKSFTVDAQDGELFVRFDGVYMDCTVYVNGTAVGDWKYGYSTFAFCITPYVKLGENEMVVLVRHQSPNSRWYSGAGIYRNVWLKKCSNSYLPFDGTYVSTKVSCEAGRADYACPEGMDFVMELETEVAGAGENLSCVYSLWKENRKIFSLGEVGIRETDSNQHENKNLLRHTAIVPAPKLWDIENPICYRLQVELVQDEECVDEQWYTVGFRTMEFDPARGFFLNGKLTKVHGVCEHHDLGCLGSAVNEKALRRQFAILKEMGVNGLRTSHNMPDPMFMELADTMGFLVLSEAFDMWEREKTPYDYARFFKEWADKDVASWIRRDRNHPSLMLWSIGNEIYDTHADSHGEEITVRLCEFVRKHDPKKNAPITIGSNYMPWEGAQNCADIVKYAGYNYTERLYKEHHEKHPDWIIYGSETASVVQSRGVYHFPLKQSILADEDEQCSALGNSSTSWGAISTEQCIIDDRDATFAFGQFIWTGFDYIGEPTPYHTKNSYFGQIDTAGFPKDSYYIFQSAWTDYKTKPMIHIFPYWDFNVGQLIDLLIATNAPQAELWVNGVSLGRQTIDHAHGQRLMCVYQTPYEPGTILAVAYDEKGGEIAREEKKSFGDSKSIRLIPDKTTLTADGKDLCFITIETLDEQGNVVENASDYVQVTLEGAGRLMGMDNGDSTDYDDYKCNTRRLFSGKLLAVIGSTYEEGSITVTVKGQGLESGTITLESVPAHTQNSTLECTRGFLAACKEIAEIRQVPVRKIEIAAPGEKKLSPDRTEVVLEAIVYPENASVHELLWKAVNDSGIEVNYAVIEKISREGNREKVRLIAKGDGAFRVRCMHKDENGKITPISQVEYEVEGMGQTFLNPYQLVIAGLYTEAIGEIGNGNEKGISTAREGDSGVVFADVDFGEVGSDQITMPVFALDDQEYIIDIWLGKPGESGSELLLQASYKKPSIWNVYQEETWNLGKTLKGVQTISFVLHGQKLHIKGFCFKKILKAYSKLMATSASRIYGDSFVRNGDFVEDIGNNVTFEFDHMDFGASGSCMVEICGKTDLPVNTIHVHFHPEDGSQKVMGIAEFVKSDEYCVQKFKIEKLAGKGRMDLIFLPGSQFSLSYVRFLPQ